MGFYGPIYSEPAGAGKIINVRSLTCSSRIQSSLKGSRPSKNLSPEPGSDRQKAQPFLQDCRISCFCVVALMQQNYLTIPKGVWSCPISVSEFPCYRNFKPFSFTYEKCHIFQFPKTHLRTDFSQSLAAAHAVATRNMALELAQDLHSSTQRLSSSTWRWWNLHPQHWPRIVCPRPLRCAASLRVLCQAARLEQNSFTQKGR